ncbi:helix-turn-helix domain-containing protein [Pelistega sp. MC2]|uniref:helix-turn-helix domain-containing protein n=1 Tax=Pelistega sp. MC2 TaxID=1720297 RepID=UPI0008D9A12D|nr:helix-turn-helix transcriptional regulator [Pelistega sp. MC2]
MMNTFSERLLYAMKEKGVSQLDLAKIAGVSTTAVNKWIKGSTKNIKGTHLIAVADCLDVSISWLVNGCNATSPFKKISLEDLRHLPAEYIEDIEDYILMKIQKFEEKQLTKQERIA